MSQGSTDLPPEQGQPAQAADEQGRSTNSNHDLLRLRNEVRLLRSQMAELDQARAENLRIRKAMEAAQNPAAAPVKPAEGFIGKEMLADLGFDTPEAAAQTFFAALRDGNVKRMLESASPNFKKRQGFDRLPPEQFEALEPEIASGLK